MSKQTKSPYEFHKGFSLLGLFLRAEVDQYNSIALTEFIT